MIEQFISNESQTFDKNPISRLNLNEVDENLDKKEFRGKISKIDR